MARPLLTALVLATGALGPAGHADAGEFEKAPSASALVACPSKGLGFVRMPGSQTCTRVSGRVTVGAELRSGHGLGPTAPSAITGRLAIDNRADTDLGEVRTYVRIGNGRR